MEALKLGRRVIISDLNPIATEITRLTIKPVSESKLKEAFKRIENKIRNKIDSLYLTECRSCGKEIPFTCSRWEGDKCVEIRYQNCPQCGDTPQS
jgi:adenine-specific DNA methylase